MKSWVIVGGLWLIVGGSGETKGLEKTDREKEWVGRGWRKQREKKNEAGEDRERKRMGREGLEKTQRKRMGREVFWE